MDCLQITFDAPPPSPTGPITFDSSTSIPDIPVMSPKRKPRQLSDPSEKRQKKMGTLSSGKSRSSLRQSGKSFEQLTEVPRLTTTYPEPMFTNSDLFSVPPLAIGGKCPDQDGAASVPPCDVPFESLTTNPHITSYDQFVDAVLAAECDFWQISRNLFIVNGWNRQAKKALDAFYHLRVVVTGAERKCYCVCPEGRLGDECFHVRFMKDHGDQRFPVDHHMTEGDDEDKRRTILVSRNIEQYEPMVYRNIFSVPSPGALVSAKNRAIVEHYGSDTGSGTWKCSKDAGSISCVHILRGRDSLQKYVHLDDSAKDDNTQMNFASSSGNVSFRYWNPSSTDQLAGIFARGAVDDMPAVSYKMIPPPPWARISSDPELSVVPAPREPPELIRLTSCSSCSCRPHSRNTYSPEAGFTKQRCQIYGLTRMWYSNIEVQQCSLCKHRFIGPDCQAQGLFNWNNSVLVTHDLLDDYTSSYSASETPFTAWAAVLARRYQAYGSPLPFLSEKRFRVIWFAYARLLDLRNDMRCTKCGPTPKVTIWDGVTLAFSRKNLKPSLCPPTTIHPASKVRRQAQLPDKPQCIQDFKLRRDIRYILTGPPLCWIEDDGDVPDNLIDIIEEPSDDEAEEAEQSKKALRVAKAKLKAVREMQARIKMVGSVVERLKGIDGNLANLFKRCYGLQAVLSGRIIPLAYAALFMQIASDESALQLVSRPVIDLIVRFTKQPTFQSASRLNMFPALYKVIMLELSDKSAKRITTDLLGVCHWLALRAMTVFKSTFTEVGGEKDAEGVAQPLSWQKTGCCYSMPQIRYRPQYPLIHRDGMRDLGGQVKRRDGCGKYYAQYGQKRLTGGIMVVWCTHAICYGFHCIPTAEGRNEVFSAIYTHWEKAPEIIIYDYACNLASYIMAREPEFFANTKCLIDHFHSAGHSACGDACKLMTYVPTNPDLDKINSSAAESGNSGLLRIRKSVSYMTQDHAIIYTKVFLSIRNRLMIRKQEMETSKF